MPTQGPFSSYLNEPLQGPTTPNPTGFESGGAEAAFLAGKFLDGIREHRNRQFQLQQLEEEKARRGYETALNAIQSNNSLTPQKRQELMAPLIQGLIGQAGSIKETGKHTGNPMTDLVKNFMSNLAGGPLPKGQALDMGTVGTALTEMNNPENRIDTHLTRGQQAASRIISSMGQDATEEKLLNNPEFANIIATTRANTGIQNWMPVLGQLPKNDLELASNRAKQAYMAKYYGTQPPPVQQQPQPQPSATPEQQQTAPIPATSGAKTLADIRKELNDFNQVSTFAKSNGLPPPTGEAPTIEGSDQQYYDPSREQGSRLFQGVNVVYPGNQNYTGIYDVSSGARVPGAHAPTTKEKGELGTDQLKNANDLYQSYVTSLDALRGQFPKKANQPALDTEFNLYHQLLGAAAKSANPTEEMGRVMNSAKTALDTAIRREGDERERQSRIAANLEPRFQNMVNTAANGIRNSQQYKFYQTVRAQQDAANVAMLPGTAEGLKDIMLIRAAALATDPGSTVRNEEELNFKSILPYAQRYLPSFMYEKFKTAKRLDDASRQAILNSINGLTDARMKAVNQLITGQLNGIGIPDVKNGVLQTFLGEGFNPGTAKPPAPSNASGSTPKLKRIQ